MSRIPLLLVPAALAAALLAPIHAGAADAPASAAAVDWSMNATIIEACSCPMFCQCYFATRPAAHAPATAGHAEHSAHAGHDHAAASDPAGHGGGDHFCKFNNAFRVNAGHHGATRLDGARFWVAGDLGDEFSDGEMDWAVLTYDPSVTPAQREGIQAALAHLYPVKWKRFSIAEDAKMDWSADRDVARATLDGGRLAEVRLARNRQSNTDAPIVIQNLKYWGAPRNDGFVLMQNAIEAYRAGDDAFEFKGTNGFMITFDISSKDVAAKP